MAAAGIFGEDDRVELLDGEIIEMTPIRRRHAGCVNRLARLLAGRLQDLAVLSVQNPVRLDPYSEPQPDLALLRPRPDDYAGSHPGPSDILLIIEVADTSAGWDRRRKVPVYAAAGVPECWLADLAAETLEVSRQPEAGAYREVWALRPGEAVVPAAFPDVVLEVADLLPQPARGG